MVETEETPEKTGRDCDIPEPAAKGHTQMK
jgi:hypothetical protein